jgi:beta-phosphoglucomutase
MSNVKNPPAIIWDMDGVLIDSGDLHYYTWRDVLDEELGLPLTRSEFDATFGADNFNTLAQFIGREPTPELLKRLAGRKEAVYREGMRQHVHPIQASIEMVERLHERGWEQIVATSAPRENVEKMMEVFAFDRWFGSYVCVDDVANGKPAPDVFLKAADLLGVAPARCVVIEDSSAGVQAARAAGMACLALLTTQPAEALQAADRIVESLAGLTPDNLAALARQNGHSPERKPTT